jgi:hypothetical protein
MGAFVPPPLDSHQGPAPDSSFTPPPLSSHQGPADQPGALSRFASSVYDTTLHPIVQSLAHPIDAALDIGKALIGKDDLDAITNAVHSGDYKGAAMHLGRWALSRTPEGAALKTGYDIARPTIDRLQEGDYAGAAGAATGTALGLALPEGRELAGDTAGATLNAASTPLRDSAIDQATKVLAPTTKANKLRAAEVVPGLLDRGMPLTLKGIAQKAQANIQALGQQIGDAWDNLPDGTSVKLQDVHDAIDKNAAGLSVDVPARQVGTQAVDTGIKDAAGNPVMRQEPVIQPASKVPKGPVAQQGMANLQKLKDTLADVAEPDPQTGEMQVPVERIRAMRQFFDDVAADAGRYDGGNLSDSAQAKAHGMAADAIRGLLNDAHPDIATLNKEYSFWKNVSRVAQDSLTRKGGQGPSLGSKIAGGVMQGAGAAAGGPKGWLAGTAASKLLGAAMNSEAWPAVSAKIKNGVAGAIASGSEGNLWLWAGRAADAAGVLPAAAAEVKAAGGGTNQ